MKNSILTLQAALLTVVLLMTPLFAGAADVVKLGKIPQAKSQGKAQQQEQYFLIQIAPTATVALNQDKKSYTVTLKNVAPHVTYFSDRPTRTVGHIPLQQYLDLWVKGKRGNFHVMPPNAAIQATQSGKTVSCVVILNNPNYDADANTLSYTLIPLEKNTMPVDNKSLEHVSLLIDDVCVSCFYGS